MKEMPNIKSLHPNTITGGVYINRQDITEKLRKKHKCDKHKINRYIGHITDAMAEVLSSDWDLSIAKLGNFHVTHKEPRRSFFCKTKQYVYYTTKNIRFLTSRRFLKELNPDSVIEY